MEYKYIQLQTPNRIRNTKIEIVVAKLYCFLLPFRMLPQLSFLQSIVGGCANYLPFIFHLVGMLLWMINENGILDFYKKKELIWYATKLTIWLSISSVIMAFVIQNIYGNQGSENAFQGIKGMLIYFIQYFCMFIYNYRVFQILSIDEMNKIIHINCFVLLIIGYFQVLVMNGIGTGVYDRINYLGILNTSSQLPKLCLTGNEGASAGCIIGVFIMPFLFSHIIIGKRKCVFEALLWLIPLYYTYSSTAYILFIVDVIVLLVFLIIKSDKPSRGFITLVIIILCVGITFMVLYQGGLVNEDQINNIHYLLFEKASDENNGSTIARNISLLVNWGAFTEYPILGVGNGLQGYFYESYFPAHALKVAGSDAGVFLDRSREGISNGGVFTLSLLSGYGIIGCFFILVFVGKCIKSNALNKASNRNFYFLYIIAGIAFIIMGFQGDAYGLYYAWFMLSIPFMTQKKGVIK